MRTRLSRQCYDKFWRCPGWVGGGFRASKRHRCNGGGLLVPGSWNKEHTAALPDDRWWKWRWYRCRKDCGVIALPYVTRWLDPTWLRWKVRCAYEDWKYERDLRRELADHD